MVKDKVVTPEDDPQSGFLEGPGGQIKPVYKYDKEIPDLRDMLADKES